MPRGQIVIKSWKDERGVCFNLRLVAAINPCAALSLEFFRTVVHSEAPSEKSKKALNQLFERTRSGQRRQKGDHVTRGDEVIAANDAPLSMSELVDCAVEYYECEPECKEKLFSVFAAVQSGQWDKSFAQLREALENSRSETTLKLINSVARPSCYFVVDSSDARPNSIVDPFFSLRTTEYARRAVRWIMKEIMGKPRSEKVANTPELWKACVCNFWAEAVLSDMLLQLGKPAKREAVWKKLGEMGLEFDEMFKSRIVSCLQAEASSSEESLLTEAARDPEVHWKYNKEAFELARHQWTEKWADVFAEKFNQSEQGIARYKCKGGRAITKHAKFVIKTNDGPARDVLEWISHDTHYEPWFENEDYHRGKTHSYFLRRLGEYCRARWLDDVYKELWEYSRSLRGSMNHESLSNKEKEFIKKIGSLGLSFSPTAILALTQHLQRPDSLHPKRLSAWDRPSIKLLASNKFKVDPAKVGKRNASYIKAALGQPADDGDCNLCGTCARKPDDSCFYSGAGSLACLEYAIDKGLNSGMFFQGSHTVSPHHKRPPLPALKSLRTMNAMSSFQQFDLQRPHQRDSLEKIAY